jgi:hypothetical protein
MKRMMGLAVAAAALASGRGLWAEGMADHVPADAMVFVEWPGTDALGAGYNGSNLKGIVDALELRSRIEQAISSHEANTDDPEAKATIEMVRGWVSAAARNPGMVYVGPVDFSGDKPMPKIAIVSKVGAAKASEMAGKAKEAIEKQEKKEGEPPVSVVASGEYVVLNVGKDVSAEQWLTTAPGESLGSSAKYKGAMGQAKVTGTSALTFYLNGEAAVQAVLEGTAKLGEPTAQQYAPVIIDALGLGALRQAAATGGFDGPNWSGKGFVGLEGPRKGLFGFVDFPALTAETYALAPSGSAYAAVVRFDGNRLLTDVRDAVVKVSPQQGGQQFDMVVRQVYAFTGVDLQKDLFPSLGDAFVVYATPDKDGTIRQMTIANKLKDAAKGEEALTGLETFANQFLAQRAAGTLTFAQEPLESPNEKVTAHLITTPVGTGAWAVKDGVLYISGGKAGLEQAVSAKGAGVSGDASFKALQAKLGQQQVGGFAYCDLTKVGPGYYGAIKDAATQAMQQQGKEMPELPGFEKLKPYMGAGLSVWWMDEAGLHMSETGPFPGWNAVNPQMELQMRMQKKLMGVEETPAPATP